MKDLSLKLEQLYNQLDDSMRKQYKRSLSIGELLTDRFKRAAKLGFGKGSSIYDSSLLYGDVQVGEHTWIGPNTIVDGSGGLSIGNHCAISAGVQIYTHDSIKKTLSSGKSCIEHSVVSIGNNVYVGPNSIIRRGIKIGDHSVVGSCSYVNQNVPPNRIVLGQPAKVVGEVKVMGDEIELIYYK